MSLAPFLHIKRKSADFTKPGNRQFNFWEQRWQKSKSDGEGGDITVNNFFSYARVRLLERRDGGECTVKQSLLVLRGGSQTRSGEGCEWMGQEVRGWERACSAGRCQQGERLGQQRRTGHGGESCEQGVATTTVI